MPPVHLSQELVDEIIRIGFLRYPREACGVLLPTPRGHGIESMVVELPNRSTTEAEYIIYPDDIRLEIAGWARGVSEDQRRAVAVWHTHPGGNVGPSRGDLRNRIEGVSYLVVALDTGGTGVPTWF